jgi:hypothetical protein
MADYAGAGLGQMRIASLKVGDVIKIAAGNGVPVVEEDTVDTVVSTDGGFSIVTASGITLFARHGYGVEKITLLAPA